MRNPSRPLLLLAVIVVAAWLPSAVVAGIIPAIPGNLDVTIQTANAVPVGLPPGSNANDDLQRGCEFSTIGVPVVRVNLLGWISDSFAGTSPNTCGFQATEAGITTTEVGWYSGYINPGSGDTTFTYTTQETLETVATGKIRFFTVELTGTGVTTSGRDIVGTANFTVEKSCSAGTGSGPTAVCAASDTASYTGTVPFSIYIIPPDTDDPRIDHIEVVQVVQSPTNSVPLVANKSTVARVFLKSPPTASIETITLEGIRNGTPLAGDQPQRLNGGAETIDATFDRDFASDSVNFLLPATWTTAGNIELKATLTASGVPDPNTANNTKTVQVLFQARNPLTIETIELCILLTGQQPDCEYDRQYRKPVDLEAMFPVADGGLTYRRAQGKAIGLRFELDTVEAQNLAMSKIQERWVYNKLHNLGAPDQISAWIRDTHMSVGGLSDGTSIGGDGRASIVAWHEQNVVGSHKALGHEIAHNLGLPHVPPPHSCNAEEDHPNWPYTNGTIQQPGWDFVAGTVTPSTHFDLMTYCLPFAEVWLSPHNYERLFQANSVPPPAPAFDARVASEIFVISGYAEASGSGGAIESIFREFSSVEFPPSDPAGTHCFKFNEPGLDYCFTPVFENADHQLSSRGYFVVPVPASPLTLSSITLCKSPCGPGDTLATKTKSSSGAALSIVFPLWTDTFEGDTATLVWTANDPDPGDTVTFHVLYSTNGGQSYVPIATGLTETELEIDSDLIAGSPQGVFRVVASDGFISSEAYAGPIPVGTARPWGDLRCDGALDVGDLVSLKRETIGDRDTSPATCKFSGSAITVHGFDGNLTWGDLKCDGIAGAEDALELMRVLAGYAANPTGDCPAVGAPTYGTW